MEPLRGGLIGFGFIAEHGHVPAYASRAVPLEVVAVAEPCTARHAAIARLLPGARVYRRHEDLLAREKLDFVDVCTPPASHAPIALEALERRLHVLCEKPLAATASEADTMAQAARRTGRVLYPGHSYRHAPVVRAVRGALEGDRIGRVTMATLDTYRTGHARGVPEWQPDWRRDPRQSGGGILLDHGPHTSYLAFEWMGGYPSSVSAWTRALRGGVEDDAALVMTFARGIVRAHLTWNAAFRRVIYTLHGERGAIRVEDDEVEILVRTAGGDVGEKIARPSDWKDAGHGPWFEGVLRGFVRAVREGDVVGAETRDALMGMRTIDAALRSARRGGGPAPVQPLEAARVLEKSA
jgi:predicted dehydrogenase